MRMIYKCLVLIIIALGIGQVSQADSVTAAITLEGEVKLNVSVGDSTERFRSKWRQRQSLRDFTIAL
jgi:hypothetical protein